MSYITRGTNHRVNIDQHNMWSCTWVLQACACLALV